MRTIQMYKRRCAKCGALFAGPKDGLKVCPSCYSTEHPPLPQPMRTITQISAADRHIYALCSDGSIWEKDRCDADWNLMETPFTSPSKSPLVPKTNPGPQIDFQELRKRIDQCVNAASDPPTANHLARCLVLELDSALKSTGL